MILIICVFFFNDTATTEIYTLSLHDALPIWLRAGPVRPVPARPPRRGRGVARVLQQASAGAGPRGRRCGGSRRAVDRKSTRLNSSHANISYAVFCLKKKTIKRRSPTSSCRLL